MCTAVVARHVPKSRVREHLAKYNFSWKFCWSSHCPHIYRFLIIQVSAWFWSDPRMFAHTTPSSWLWIRVSTWKLTILHEHHFFFLKKTNIFSFVFLPQMRICQTSQLTCPIWLVCVCVCVCVFIKKTGLKGSVCVCVCVYVFVCVTGVCTCRRRFRFIRNTILVQ